MIIVEPSAPTTPEATRLLDASQALMRRLYKPEENNFLTHDALQAENIDFFVARIGDEVLGCAALMIKPDYGEVKSFYTDEAARGRGIGAALLRQLEDHARSRGLSLLRLETGDALAAACRLYERHGYTRCGVFGDYADNGVSVFMEKPLPQADHAAKA
ncbi:GNAT family N-acetyltransferase [Pseudooceanicola sediminis]|uniref:GNAT family N-acetyltransferase n=1 Tax=Pseudooceanicola sediminis TaxID=2211117 RepID=A0A399IZU0_9RHOB|nr:GNAT family N-acetyltransferase [Pseudooceanicola sediminis]KAA2313584.1 GNAT family N-acetyltransferase [Puniceibacterium sp. HSS470]RII38571.1 GNAT family N-acetyltransferase [Pseudooceanicola sediminis]|tara:strand:- start:35537 stop:36013 length:477 start_codon:yes stop_codon:yes gene_type:complete